MSFVAWSKTMDCWGLDRKIGQPNFILDVWNIGEFELYIRDFPPHFSIKFGCKGIVQKLLFFSITQMIKVLVNSFSKKDIDEYILFRDISLLVILSSPVLDTLYWAIFFWKYNQQQNNPWSSLLLLG